jgi:ABC-type cobalt transport system substrate-binding protein
VKKAILILIFAGLLLPEPWCATGHAASWSGVDETVIEKFAEKAGRPAREPFINTDQGDLLLFVFLLAGAVGGFAAGYWFRVLFPPRRRYGEGNDAGADGTGNDGKRMLKRHV